MVTSVKIPFMPTIIEHAASFISRTPSSVAQNANLLAMAHIAAYKHYLPDAVTIGMDIYNIEAEALGCTVRFYDDTSIPGIVGRLCYSELNLESITFSKDKGRIGLLLEAASVVKAEIGGEVGVSVGICGAFSILIEMFGFEAALDILCDEVEVAHNILAQLLEFQKAYCTEIAALGIGIVVFESWASPPLISPAMYQQFALPYESQLFAHMKEIGITVRPLVIGGDTRGIVNDMLDSGTTLLLSDYNTPLEIYVEKAREKDLTVRVNIDPKLIQNGDWDSIAARVHEIHTHAKSYGKIIAGSGVVPYNTSPENLLRVKQVIDGRVK